MANLNFIMPLEFKEQNCKRNDTNKVRHVWLPTGQTRAIIDDNIAIECYCKHCNLRVWTTVARAEYAMLQDYWLEL